MVKLVLVSKLEYLLSPPRQPSDLLHGTSIDPFPDPRRRNEDCRTQGLNVIQKIVN